MIKIALVDDHKILLEGIASLLNKEEDYDVVAQFTSGKACLEKFEQYLPDILISDIEMPDLDGIELAKHISNSFPDTKIIALTSFNEQVYVKEMLKAGASGYLLKNAGINIFKEAISTVCRGEKYYDKEVMMHFLESNIDRRRKLPSQQLSDREIQIVKLLSDQLTTKQIAEELHLSPLTVKTHRKNILLKLGMNNTAGIIKYAIEKGII